MYYTEKQEQLSIAAKELIDSLKKFRDASDAIMMDNDSFNVSYRYSIKDLYDKATNLQLDIVKI